LMAYQCHLKDQLVRLVLGQMKENQSGQ